MNSWELLFLVIQTPYFVLYVAGGKTTKFIYGDDQLINKFMIMEKHLEISTKFNLISSLLKDALAVCNFKKG